MTKRPHDEAAEAGESGSSSPKRQRCAPAGGPAEALALLLQEHAKELRACLKAMKKEGKAEGDGSLARLTALSETLLPAVRAITGNDKATADTAAANTAAANTATVETTAANTTTADTTADKTAAAPAAPTPIPVPVPLAPAFGNILPALDGLTAWTVHDIPKTHPPLPAIPDAELARMALTHHGMRRRDGEASYETLEFLGDAFIYHVASELISQTFPRLLPGRQSQLREGILRNTTLARYTQHYGIHARATLPAEFGEAGRPSGTKVSDKERLKVHGDLFESYVGALIRARRPGAAAEDGVATAIRWLKPLWAMTLADEIRAEYRSRQALEQTVAARPVYSSSTAAAAAAAAEPGSAPGAAPGAPGGVPDPVKVQPAKVQLAALVGCPGVVIRYENVAVAKAKKDRHTKMPLFTTAVWVDGWGRSESLGQGSALNKREAGERAAELALRDKKRIKFYVDKKAAFLEARAALAAEAEAQAEGQ